MKLPLGFRWLWIPWLGTALVLGWQSPANSGIQQETGVTTPAPDVEPMGARFFVLSESCARCHDASKNATALWTESGEDASPHGTWSGSVMAHSYVDPYWRAQIEREIALAAPEERKAREELCTRCHAPAAVHEARLAGEPLPTLAQLDQDPAAKEGVSCTVCHRITPDGLGTDATFHGNLPIDFAANLYGPYPDPFDGPMANMSGYSVKFGAHIVQSSLCATCHTLETGHGAPAGEADGSEGGGKFLEQSPYLEWRNSVFSYEDGMTAESRSCQNCHMPELGSMKIAHNPQGTDFGFLFDRPEVRSHAIVGGNALLLDMLRLGREKLKVTTPVEQLESMAAETRRQLAQDTALLDIESLGRTRERIQFRVVAENLTGHKLPTGYPSRRIWLEVQVQSQGITWFQSGVPAAEGRILEQDQALRQPHHELITEPGQVQIWEMIAADEKGEPTTHLSAMRKPIKDNRLLPRGWRAAGPHGHATAPVGIGDDENFVGGSDMVTFDVPIPEGIQEAPGRIRITARVLYQSIPPAWADDHRDSEGEAAKRFLDLYDKAPTRFEVLAEAQRLIR